MFRFANTKTVNSFQKIIFEKIDSKINKYIVFFFLLVSLFLLSIKIWKSYLIIRSFPKIDDTKTDSIVSKGNLKSSSLSILSSFDFQHDRYSWNIYWDLNRKLKTTRPKSNSLGFVGNRMDKGWISCKWTQFVLTSRSVFCCFMLFVKKKKNKKWIYF